MPPFVLGVEEAVAFGDFGTRRGRCRSPGPGLVDPRRAHGRRVRRLAVL